MKVVVTGGTGFVGSHTAAALLDAGHEVRMFVRSPGRVGAALDPLGVSVDDVVAGDVNDEAAAADAVEGCDALVHVANVYSFDPRDVDDMRRTNVHGTEVMLRAAQDAGHDPIIHVSTGGVLLGHDEPIRDDTPIGVAVGPYSASKIEAERVARRMQAEGAPVVTVYPGPVWGPHDPHDGEGTELLIAIARGRMRMLNRGVYPICDVRDVAAVIVALVEPGHGPRRCLATGHSPELIDVATLVGEITGRNLKPLPSPAAMAIGTGRLCDFLASRFGVGVPFSAEGRGSSRQPPPSSHTWPPTSSG